MGEVWDKDNIMMGLEMGLTTQEQIVGEFQDLVDQDIATAADRYAEFAERLEQVASGGSAQILSLIGGPDYLSRAGLVDIMVGSYVTASNDVKEKIRDEAMRSLLRDSFFIVQSTVARMKNPHLVGDIIREEPLSNPGVNYYEEDLLKTGDTLSPGFLQSWLNKLDRSLFAATTVALQRGNEADVSVVIDNNEPLFQDAAHVTAAYHDYFAEIKILKGSSEPKSELAAKYRSSFVDSFAEMTRLKAEQANWLPLGSKILQLYSS